MFNHISQSSIQFFCFMFFVFFHVQCRILNTFLYSYLFQQINFCLDSNQFHSPRTFFPKTVNASQSILVSFAPNRRTGAAPIRFSSRKICLRTGVENRCRLIRYRPFYLNSIHRGFCIHSFIHSSRHFFSLSLPFPHRLGFL